VLLSPLFAVAAGSAALGALRRREDRGALLYREPRISRGRTFGLLKFRTLRLEVLAAAGSGEAHARLLEAEPANLTWAGRKVLKPWYLDELPQLWNVLRGDMSLVGPRPWPPSMVERQVASGQDYRLRTIAGWTGPAQVRKGVVDPADYEDLDLEYVQACESWSALRLVRHDLRLLWETVRLLARGEGLRY
jgi:lipopolysaccharide/colanic/teichoic acid biosynthesis glycosyltransferase